MIPLHGVSNAQLVGSFRAFPDKSHAVHLPWAAASDMSNGEVDMMKFTAAKRQDSELFEKNWAIQNQNASGSGSSSEGPEDPAPNQNGTRHASLVFHGRLR